MASKALTPATEMARKNKVRFPNESEASRRSCRGLRQGYRRTDAEKFGRERRGPLEVPLVLVGGAVPKKGFGELLPAVAKGLKDAGARSVAVETIAGSGHYVVDEKPAELAALIERYASAP